MKHLKTVYIDCECKSLSHVLRLSFDTRGDDVVYVSTFLNPSFNFLQRLYTSLSYLFGFSNKGVEKLLKIYCYDRGSSDYECVWSLEDVEKVITTLEEFKTVYKENDISDQWPKDTLEIWDFLPYWCEELWLFITGDDL